MSDFLNITNTMNSKNPVLQYSGSNLYYVFNSPGTYTIKITNSAITDISYLVVGGGGGSATINGANGGSIQFGTLSQLSTNSEFTLVVGKGGTGQNNGNPSSIANISAPGGNYASNTTQDGYGHGGDGCNGELSDKYPDTTGSSIKYNIVPGIKSYTYKYTAGYGGLGLSSNYFVNKNAAIGGIQSAGGGGGPIYVDTDGKIGGIGSDGGASTNNNTAINGGGGCGVDSTSTSTGGNGVIVIQYTTLTPISKPPVAVSAYKKCPYAGGCATLGFRNITEGMETISPTPTSTISPTPTRPMTPTPTSMTPTPTSMTPTPTSMTPTPTSMTPSITSITTPSITLLPTTMAPTTMAPTTMTMAPTTMAPTTPRIPCITKANFGIPIPSVTSRIASYIHDENDYLKKSQMHIDQAKDERNHIDEMQDSYRKRIMEYIKMIIVLCIVLVFMWLIRVLYENEWLPSGALEFITITVISIGCIVEYILYFGIPSLYVGLASRNLLDFDAINYDPPAKSSTSTTTMPDITPTSGSGTNVQCKPPLNN